MSKYNPYHHRTKRFDRILRKLQKELKKHNFHKSYYNYPFRFFKYTTLSDIVVLALQIQEGKIMSKVDNRKAFSRR